jgi:hypothetical protein
MTSAAARATINRENAQSSTGPKTAEGKERSRLNSLGHGMTSKTIVLPHESQEEFDALHQGMIEAHSPANDHEIVLVKQIAEAYWRMQRCYGVERAFLESRTAEAEDPEAAMANLFIDKAESARMRLLMRYVSSAERAYNKALSDLKKMQAERRKQEKQESLTSAWLASAKTVSPSPAKINYTNGFVSQPAASPVAQAVSPARAVKSSGGAAFSVRSPGHAV